MRNDLAYAHGSDWDEVNEQSCPFDWKHRDLEEDDLDDYFDDEEEDLDDEDSDFDDYL